MTQSMSAGVLSHRSVWLCRCEGLYKLRRRKWELRWRVLSADPCKQPCATQSRNNNFTSRHLQPISRTIHHDRLGQDSGRQTIKQESRQRLSPVAPTNALSACAFENFSLTPFNHHVQLSGPGPIWPTSELWRFSWRTWHGTATCDGCTSRHRSCSRCR